MQGFTAPCLSVRVFLFSFSDALVMMSPMMPVESVLISILFYYGIFQKEQYLLRRIGPNILLHGYDRRKMYKKRTVI